MNVPGTKRLMVAACTLAAFASVCVLWPPIRIVSLSEIREAEARANFDPESFARQLWTERFPALQDSAHPATQVLALLAQEPETAVTKYGTVWGLGGNTYFLIKGTGRIAEKQDDRLKIEFEGESHDINTFLVTNHLFGNAVRNASGLIDPSKFPNSQDLNKLSIALNKLVSEEVLTPLRQNTAIGEEIAFCGCMEVPDLNKIQSVDIVPIYAVFAEGQSESVQ